MKILYCANNLVGYQVLQFLVAQGVEVVGLVLHPAHEQKYVEEMQALVQLSDDKIFLGTDLDDPATQSAISALGAELCLSVLFGFIFRDPYFKIFPRGIVNMHPSMLPYNRGQYPNIWSIVDRTPAGVTLHYIDAGIDTGAVIAQQQVPVEPVDTGETLYRKLELAAVELFQNTWPALAAGTAPRIEQAAGEGSFYRTKDIEKIREFEPDKRYEARELIDVIRALTFPPHRGAQIRIDGKLVQVRLSLEYVPESDDESGQN